jgi:hypothetical protein
MSIATLHSNPSGKVVLHARICKLYVQAIIQTSSTLKLPNFLQLRFANLCDVASDDARVCSASAAELLRELVATGRDSEAAAIVHESIELWLQGSAGLVSHARALWLPYKTLSGLMHALERRGLQQEATQLTTSLQALHAHEAQTADLAMPA